MNKMAVIIAGLAVVAAVYIAKPWKLGSRQALPIDVLAVLTSSETWVLYRVGEGDPVSVAGVTFDSSGPPSRLDGDQKTSLMMTIQEGIRARAHEDPYVVAQYGPEFVLHATHGGAAVILMFSFGAMERIDYTIGPASRRGVVNTSSYPRDALENAYLEQSNK